MGSGMIELPCDLHREGLPCDTRVCGKCGRYKTVDVPCGWCIVDARETGCRAIISYEEGDPLDMIIDAANLYELMELRTHIEKIRAREVSLEGYRIFDASLEQIEDEIERRDR